MDLTSSNPHPKSSRVKKDIMKLNKSSCPVPHEIGKAHSTWSNGKATQILKTPGYRRKSYPTPKNYLPNFELQGSIALQAQWVLKRGYYHKQSLRCPKTPGTPA